METEFLKLENQILGICGDKTTEILSQTRWKVVPDLCVLSGALECQHSHTYTHCTHTIDAVMPPHMIVYMYGLPP